MVMKDFRLEVPGHGKVDVEFRLHFDSGAVSVGEIKVHSDFECGIPHKVQLKHDGSMWKLFSDHPKNENGQVVVEPQFLEDELSMTIARRITMMRDAEA